MSKSKSKSSPVEATFRGSADAERYYSDNGLVALPRKRDAEISLVRVRRGKTIVQDVTVKNTDAKADASDEYREGVRKAEAEAARQRVRDNLDAAQKRRETRKTGNGDAYLDGGYVTARSYKEQCDELLRLGSLAQEDYDRLTFD